MKEIYLTINNVLSYMDFIPADVADNIGRVFVEGIVVTKDEKPCAGIIWEIKNLMSDKTTESRIIWLSVKDDDAAVLLFEKYDESIRLEEVKQSYFSIPASVDGREKDCLVANGFSAKLSEGDEITAGLRHMADIDVLNKAKADKDVHSLLEATPEAFSDVIGRMTQNGLTGLCEDLMYLPRSYFENDVSCYLQQDDCINGLLLLHPLPSGSLKVMLMAYIGKDYSKLLNMVKKSLLSAMEKYSADTQIVIERHNMPAMALGEKLFPRDIGRPIYVGYREEY